MKIKKKSCIFFWVFALWKNGHRKLGITNPVIARNFKFGQLIEDNEWITWWKLKKSYFFRVIALCNFTGYCPLKTITASSADRGWWVDFLVRSSLWTSIWLGAQCYINTFSRSIDTYRLEVLNTTPVSDPGSLGCLILCVITWYDIIVHNKCCFHSKYLLCTAFGRYPDIYK